jgi:predicted dehydrogenase
MKNQRISRRDLLRAGGALAAGCAAPHVITSSALGNWQSPPASDRVTVGHIGVGGRGRALFAATREAKRAQSVAVADCYRNRRTAIAALCQGKAYEDFRDVLARDDIDAVVIATPDHWHVPICQLAAQAGKHVYLEKPLGLSIQQDLLCQQTARQSGRVFQYGTQQRSMPHCFRACELVRRGAIGEIRAIEVDAPNGGTGGSTLETQPPNGFDYAMWLGPAPPAPYTVDRCRPPGTYWIYDHSIGYLAGWGAHPLDLMVWGCDADQSGPIVVEGKGEIPRQGLYNTVYNWNVQVRLGKVELVFRTGADRTRFVGEEGWIEVARDPDRTRASDPRILQAELDPRHNRLKVSTHHLENFIEAVARNDAGATVTSIQESVRSDIISHLCDIAIRTGERIVWDPTQQTLTAGSQAARGMLTRPTPATWTL